MESERDHLLHRAEILYGERGKHPVIPPVYFVEPPQMPRHSESDEARALVVAFLREIADAALTLVAFALILARDAWRWCKQWKRTPKGD